MQITSPSLVLTFPDGSSVTTTSIVKDSISIKEQLYNELSPSSNTVSFQLKPDETTLIEDLIKENSDIRAVLKDGTTVLYTGYVSDNYSWRISSTGEDVLQVNLESVGTRLLNKPFAKEDDTCIRETLFDLVLAIRAKCGNIFSISYDSSVSQAIKDKILINKIDSNVSCEDVLKQVCYELGLVYFFNFQGNLVIRKTDLTQTPSITIASKGTADSYLYVEGNNAIELTKKAKQYKQVRVKYNPVQDSGTQAHIFAVQDNVQIPYGQWWDGEFHTEDLYDLTLDVVFQANKTYYTKSGSSYVEATVVVGALVPENTYYEFANSAATVNMSDLDSGKDILYVYPDTIEPNLANQTSNGYTSIITRETLISRLPYTTAKWTLKQHGSTTNLDILLDNTSANPAYTQTYSSVEAIGRIIRKLGTSSIYRAAETLTANSEIQFDYEATWIHEKSDAVALAELLNNYYLYCNNTYSFYTEDAIDLGSVVTVNENLFSGLNIKLLLVSRQYSAYGQHAGLYKYTAQAVSEFNLVPVIRTDLSDSLVKSLDSVVSIKSIDRMYAASSTQTQPTSGWSPTIPVLDPVNNKYLWLRERVLYTNGTEQLVYSLLGVYGDAGEDANILELDLTSPTYQHNKRSSGSDSINASVSLQGLYTSGVVTVKGPLDNLLAYITEKNGSAITPTSSISVVDGDTFKLSIPYANDFDIKVTLTSTDTVERIISPIDSTNYGFNYGLLASAPTASSNPTPIYEAGKATDFYTNSTDGITYEYTGSSWVACTDASRLTIGLKLLLDGGIDISTLSNANSVSFFKDIIAQQIYVNTIKAVQGFFDSIHVSGLSQFDGQIVNDAMTTFPSETSTRAIRLTNASGVGNVNPMYWSDGHGNVLSGPLDPNNPNNPNLSPRGSIGNLYTPLLSVDDLSAAFPQYGTYIATAGTLTFTGLSGTEYYAASPAVPIILIYQQNYFAIQRNGVTLVTYGVYNTVTDETYHHLFYPPFPNMLIISDRALQRQGGSTSYGRFATYQGSDSLQIGGYAGYAEMTNIVPKTTTNYIGTTSKPYDVIRANQIYGSTLGGTLNGNVVGNVTGDVTGNLLGNVNSSATGGTYNVFGAVFN